MPPPPSPSPTCPFCRIASTYPPFPPSQSHEGHDHDHDAPHPKSNPNSIDTNIPNIKTPEPGEPGHTHLILSTDAVLAFLDIMPLTRGHVLLVSRRHFEKLDEVDIRTAREIGQWLPVLSRVVMKTVFGVEGDAQWNVVQNNGIRAAQQVPHLHFHIVPRPAVPTTGRFAAAQASYAMFGRGQRDDLDDEEGEKLVGLLRGRLAREVRRVREVEGVDLDLESGSARGKGKL